jgi:DHA1 family bicyclomycin/chloramphenicol resistance-like MFS transporter
MMASLVPLSTDMYLPGFKSIAEDFSTTTSAIQVTLSASFVGIGIGMPIWGPISDRFGRRTPAAIGILLYLVGAILCANAADLSQLVAARFVLALGGAGVMVIGRAIVRDMFVGERMARTLGAVSSVLLVSSIISPSIGAIILQFTDWRWLFMALVILG